MELEARINRLEAYKGWLAGVASVVSIAASWIFSKII
jgi:hypothetical protein